MQCALHALRRRLGRRLGLALIAVRALRRLDGVLVRHDGQVCSIVELGLDEVLGALFDDELVSAVAGRHRLRPAVQLGERAAGAPAARCSTRDLDELSGLRSVIMMTSLPCDKSTTPRASRIGTPTHGIRTLECASEVFANGLGLIVVVATAS